MTKTILIIEDSDDDLQSYRRTLARTDWQLRVAGSMASALAELRQHRVDAILLDYRLPDGNGLAFLRLLQAEFGPLPPPVVMLTGHGDETLATQAIETGANDYLVKDQQRSHLQRRAWSLSRAMQENRLRQEQWDAAQQLQRLNETLEAQVQQRTAELGLALASAQSAARSRGEFLARMSHEIRTPMNAILGMTYLALKSTSPQASSHGYLRRIDASGKHLLQIIEDILDFSKIDAGKLALEQADFDLDPLIARIVDLNEARASEKGLRLCVELDPAIPRQLRGDALRLSQVLINFVSNAIKFTSAGFIFLRVRQAPTPAAAAQGQGCLLQFEVEDTGVGVNEAQQARLFQSFEQGDTSTTRRYGGTGLGLAISKQLVQLMGGEIGVASQPGVGSRFWFTAQLQLARAASAPLAPPRHVDPGQDLMSETARLLGARVLVVDDNSFNLELAQVMLEGAGAQVTLAGDGVQALDSLAQRRFDCVLMDVQMPVLDGIEATQRIRQDPGLAGLPVIAMTANALLEDRSRCLDAGMDDVLTKPVDPPVLFAVLAKWLTRPCVAAPPPATAGQDLTL